METNKDQSVGLQVGYPWVHESATHRPYEHGHFGVATLPLTPQWRHPNGIGCQSQFQRQQRLSRLYKKRNELFHNLYVRIKRTSHACCFITLSECVCVCVRIHVCISVYINIHKLNPSKAQWKKNISIQIHIHEIPIALIFWMVESQFWSSFLVIKMTMTPHLRMIC